jgi:hypothetical protein
MVMAGLDVFDNFIRDYSRARPWMFEADGSDKITSLDMDPDNPAEWGDASMTSDDQKVKTPAEYFRAGRAWLDAAESKVVEGQDSATLGMLAMASALLGICSQFIKEQEDD